MVKNNIQEKTLSIRISTNGFCFCSYIPTEPDSLRYSEYETDKERSLASNLNTAIESCPLIAEGEKYNIKVIVETDSYTFVPAEYDNKNDYSLFFRTCFPKSENFEIVANKLHSQGHTMLFPIDKGIQEIVSRFGNVTFFTPASIIIGYLGYRPMSEKEYMFAYIYNNLAFILHMKNGKVEISNIFVKEEMENIVFYLLSIWKEERLSQTESTLYICGDRCIESFAQAAGRFIKNIKRINANELFPASLLNRIQGIPFDLQALILCE